MLKQAEIYAVTIHQVYHLAQDNYRRQDKLMYEFLSLGHA